jgi:hypothetical protein
MCSSNTPISAVVPWPAARVLHLQRRVREQHPLRRENAAHAQIQVEIAAQALPLRRELLEQHRTDRARADQADRHGVRRQIEARVDGAQGARTLLLVDDR